MKKKMSDWLTILLTAFVGIMFIVWHGNASLFEWLVRGLGVVLLIPAIYETFIAVRGLQGKVKKCDCENEEEDDEKSEEDAPTELSFARRAGYVSMLIVSGVAIIAGLWMLINPATFTTLLAYIFAVILILFGVYQLIDMIYVNRSISLEWYFFVVPVVFVLAGIIILFMSPGEIIVTVAVVTGILLVLAAINSAMRMIVISGIEKQRRLDARAAEKAAEKAAKEAEKNAENNEESEIKQIPESVD